MCDQHNFFFEFDKAFTTQLIQKFEASPAHPLTEEWFCQPDLAHFDALIWPTPSC